MIVKEKVKVENGKVMSKGKVIDVNPDAMVIVCIGGDWYDPSGTDLMYFTKDVGCCTFRNLQLFLKSEQLEQAKLQSNLENIQIELHICCIEGGIFVPRYNMIIEE